MKKLLQKIRQISTYSFSRQFTRGKQARSLGPGLLASTQDGILAGDSLGCKNAAKECEKRDMRKTTEAKTQKRKRELVVATAE